MADQSQKLLSRVKTRVTRARNAADRAKASGANRSTASRAAYKIKADALDEIAEVLSGRK